MTRVLTRLSLMDAKGYTTVSIVVLSLLAMSLINIMPQTYVHYWKMALQGAVWMVSVLVVFSGRHIPKWRAVPFALIGGGLTALIPTFCIAVPESAPTYLLGSVLFLTGVLFLSAQTIYDLWVRWKVEGDHK